MAHEIITGLGLRLCADWEQSASNIQWQTEDEDPDGCWHSCPYCVGDTGHKEHQALQMVSAWIDIETPTYD